MLVLLNSRDETHTDFFFCVCVSVYFISKCFIQFSVTIADYIIFFYFFF